MVEYIEKEAAKRYLAFGNACPDTVLYLLDEVDAADVAPVVHGEWETHTFKKEGMTVLLCICSNCDCRNGAETNFCPNCGAKMNGERKGDE